MRSEEIKTAFTEFLKMPTLKSATESYPTLVDEIKKYMRECNRHFRYVETNIDQFLLNALAEECKAQRTEFIQWIVSHLAQEVHQIICHSTISNQQWELLLNSSLVRNIIKEASLGALLADAIRSNNLNLVSILMNAFKSLRLAADKTGLCILSIAVDEGNNDMFDLLLNCGADINGNVNHDFSSLLMHEQPMDTRSPFYSAIISNNVYAAQGLITAGCEAINPNPIRNNFAFYRDDEFEQDSQLSLTLSYSLSAGRAEIAQLLIDIGARLARKDVIVHSTIAKLLLSNKIEDIQEGSPKLKRKKPSSSAAAAAAAEDDNATNLAPSQLYNAFMLFPQTSDIDQTSLFGGGDGIEDNKKVDDGQILTNNMGSNTKVVALSPSGN